MHGAAQASGGHHPRPAAPPVPPGGSPLRVDPRRLRPTPGTPPGTGGRGPLPAPAPHQRHLPVVDETSAGGVVVRPAADGEDGPQVAVIVRRNRAGRLEWCLPKGHLEGEETPQQAAIREVREETGIAGEIRTTLGVIDYWFSGETRRVHKVVHHYLLSMTGGHLTVEGDPDHEAEDAFWVPVAILPKRLSYPNEQRLAVVAREVVTRTPSLTRPSPPLPGPYRPGLRRPGLAPGLAPGLPPGLPLGPPLGQPLGQPPGLSPGLPQ